MSDGAKKGFWSTVPGFVTGAAGLLTGVVGLLTVGAQLGWIGGDGGGTSTATSVPAEAGATDPSAEGGGAPSGALPGAAGGRAGAGAVTKLEVDPDRLSFPAVGSDERGVTVNNAGTSTVAVTAAVVGTDAERFVADSTDCTRARLAPRDTCEVTVQYEGAGVVGGSEADLEVRAGGTVAATVELRGGLL